MLTKKMLTKKLPLASLLALSVACAADAPLPGLRIEPTSGGSIFYVKNVSPQPLTAYLIELVNYPGSSFSLWQDDGAVSLIQPGGDKKINITNMTVGAVPDYVKMQAAIYADGSTSGTPEKVRQLVERRRSMLETTRELISRIQKAGTGADAKSQAQQDLQKWIASLEPLSKAKRNSQAGINQAASKELINRAITALGTDSIQVVLAKLKSSEQALATSKPALS